MRGSISVVLATLAAGVSMSAWAEAPPATGFLYFEAEHDGRQQPFVVYVPRNYTPDEAWPLIVALHGYGERGSDGWKQTEVGIGTAIRRNAERFACLVLMPQCPEDAFWGAWEAPVGRGLKDATPFIDVALAETRARFNVDSARITLTGLSMGGFGTWQYGARNTDVYAAFMPVCGGGSPSDAQAFVNRPVWAFHGAADNVVPPAKSQEMVEAVKAAGGDVRYTEYEGIAHNSWDKAYGDADAIAWLLSQRRGE